ncbi:hypothetical protein GCM10010960_00370 [Arenimonas maotaiensis]|uniref:Uncharacterized protein n=1 Tax=Arenimonas maotaiensis TaxID=1446479 RepID=A0A917CAM6_9GAMM|nr:hypothetical protein [Arenimonas maotaiensis]GGF82227.1 hypothetical protein GCM10010960_00370 [Arenimonas maotaiensis]
MTALAVDHAPSVELPMRYLGMVPVWGLVTAFLILHDGSTLFISRWALNTVALTHMITLGILGNAMLGSLLQFLPVAAGVRLAPSNALSLQLPIIFNLALIGLLAGILYWPWLIPWSGLLLAFSIGFHAIGCLLAMRFDDKQTWLRIGICMVLVCLLLTAVLGLLLTLGLAGIIAMPMQRLTDIHAAIGLLGGVVLLCGCVGSVIMPMLQGTIALPNQFLRYWIIALICLLVSGVVLRFGNIIDGDTLTKLLVLPVAAFATAIIFFQWRAPHRRNRTLIGFWCLGSLSLLMAVLTVLCVSTPYKTILAGVLAIGIGLPSLVLGMLLEIAPFIAWLKLQRQRHQGSRLQSVDGLFPEYRKQRIFIFFVLSALALPAAVIWPNSTSVNLAGLLLASAHGLAMFEILSLQFRTRKFAGGKIGSQGVRT